MWQKTKHNRQVLPVGIRYETITTLSDITFTPRSQVRAEKIVFFCIGLAVPHRCLDGPEYMAYSSIGAMYDTYLLQDLEFFQIQVYACMYVCLYVCFCAFWSYVSYNNLELKQKNQLLFVSQKNKLLPPEDARSGAKQIYSILYFEVLLYTSIFPLVLFRAVRAVCVCGAGVCRDRCGEGRCFARGQG